MSDDCDTNESGDH